MTSPRGSAGREDCLLTLLENGCSIIIAMELVVSPIPVSLDSPRIVAEQEALSLAVRRAAEFLDISQSRLAAILGVSTATVSRLMNGKYRLDPARAEWQLAVLFVRLFELVDSVTGSRDELSRQWLTGENKALQGRPIELITKITDFVRVVHYLESMLQRA